jgi:threonine dehydrogenase-like Zn-dependent dehydrogenase
VTPVSSGGTIQHLFFEAAGRYVWRETPTPELTGPGQALVRPIAVASCDLDVAVAQGRAPLPPGYPQGHEGIAEVLAVGDEVTSVRPGDTVVVPFQLSCGSCRECRRGRTGSCGSLPPGAMYGLGSIAGRDGGGFLADVVLVPYADAMLVPLPADLDPVAAASLSDTVADGWRCIGPYVDELAALDPADRRILVTGGLSVGLYAAAFGHAAGVAVDYVDTDPRRLATAETLGVTVHDRPLPDRGWERYPVTVSTSADPAKLTATLKRTWPGGVCTDTGIYYSAVELPLLAMYSIGMRFVTARVDARSVIPAALAAMAAGLDLRPVVDAVVPWADASDVWAGMMGKTVFTRERTVSGS